MEDRAAAIANSRDCLRHLLISWQTSVDRGGSYEVPAERHGSALLAIAWASQVHRFGRAFLQLEKVGLENECHPLVRSALEYAVVGHWVAKTGDNAVIARYSEDQRQLRAMVLDAKGSKHDVIPSPWDAESLAEFLDDEPIELVDESKFITNFAELCQNLGIRGTIYNAYRLHCWITHPTTHSANLYVADGHQLSPTPRTGSDTGLVAMMAHCVFWSRRTVDDLVVGHPEQEFLNELAIKMNVVARLPDPKPPAANPAAMDAALLALVNRLRVNPRAREELRRLIEEPSPPSSP